MLCKNKNIIRNRRWMVRSRVFSMSYRLERENRPLRMPHQWWWLPVAVEPVRFAVEYASLPAADNTRRSRFVWPFGRNPARRRSPPYRWMPPLASKPSDHSIDYSRSWLMLCSRWQYHTHSLEAVALSLEIKIFNEYVFDSLT